MVINLQIHDYNVKRVLVDPGSSVDTLKWDAFEGFLENDVMVKKASSKWGMCLNFTELNPTCLKDHQPMWNIYKLINGDIGFWALCFMDTYFGYNQIKMNPNNTPKIVFMTNHNNIYYEVMLFVLKNVDETYQILIDNVFSKKIGQHLEAYIDNLVVKTKDEEKNGINLRETLIFVRRYKMRLNLNKCSFRVQAKRFLGFIITMRIIYVNNDKCQEIIDIRSLTSVKNVQYLTIRVYTLSYFVYHYGEKNQFIYLWQ